MFCDSQQHPAQSGGEVSGDIDVSDILVGRLAHTLKTSQVLLAAEAL